MIRAQLASLMWHAVVISCPLHKMSHVAQLFHGQTLSSVKHCLLLFLSLPESSAAWVMVTTSQRAHPVPGVEEARSGLQLCGDTVFPTASPRAGDTQHCMGLQKAGIFSPLPSLPWKQSGVGVVGLSETPRRSLPHNYIYADISPRHQRPGQVPEAGLQHTNPEHQNYHGTKA